MHWIAEDFVKAVKGIIRMLKDREFWRIFKKNIREMGSNPYGA